MNSRRSSSISNLKIPARQGTLEDIAIEEPFQLNTKKFFLFEILVVFLSLANTLHVYIKYNSSIAPLIISLMFIIFTILLSFALYQFNNRAAKLTKISRPLFYLLAGLGVVIIDPDTLKHAFDRQIVSYCPSLLLVILKTTLQHSFNASINLNIISICLGIIILCIRAINKDSMNDSIYLFTVLVIICVKFGCKNKTFKKIAPDPGDKYLIAEDAYDLDFSEIIYKMKGAINNISNSSQEYGNVVINNSLASLEKIWNCLKKKNIYKSNFEQVTKFMNDQDKIFIQQSCFLGMDKMINSHRKSGLVQERPQISYGVTELQGALSQIGKDWNFDTFFIASCSNKECIKVMGLYTLKKYGLDDFTSTTESCLEQFLQKLESNYRENFYHNSIHGADVMASYIYLLNNSEIIKHVTLTELLSGIIATLGHDVGHPGKTNRFLIMTKDDIATAYNDISILENMHASIIFNILKNENTDILKELSTEKYFSIRKCVIDMILATDMSRHFDMMTQFKVKYFDNNSVNLELLETRLDLYKILMKAADIGHTCKSLELHEKWCKLLIEEFYEQGDLEKALDVPVSMYCDRDTTDISKSQAGFLKNIVQPMFVCLNSALRSPHIEKNCLQQLEKNEIFWVMRRKTIRGQSLISKNEDYYNKMNSLVSNRKVDRKPSLPESAAENKIML